MSNGIGANIIIPTPAANFQESAAPFVLRASDFETHTRYMDNFDPTGIFILPVETRTAVGADNKILAEYPLEGVVVVNAESKSKLLSMGFRPQEKMKNATDKVNDQNYRLYLEASRLRGLNNITSGLVPLETLLVVAPSRDLALA